MLFQYLGLLDNFTSDIDELDLSYGNKTLKISKFAKNELGDFLFLGKSSIFSSANERLQAVIDIGEKRYWIAYSYEVDSKEAMTKAVNMADAEIEQIILALRLFKEGLVRIVFRMCKAESIGKNFTLGAFRSGERVYSLPNLEFSCFKEFLRAFEDNKQKIRPHVDIAIRRFVDGYERLKPEDRIIDYMIGLEALYLQGEEMGELSYRLAHRASVFLRKEKSERQLLFKAMKKSYKLRSKIIHGLKYHLCFEEVWFIEDVLRQSIRSFLETPSPKWAELIF
jgi:hypothetical protein